jgi:hypothetical protein
LQACCVASLFRADIAGRAAFYVLVAGGSDTPGSHASCRSYMFDIIYVTWFVHVSAALFGAWCWYFWLLVSRAVEAS